MCVDYKCKKNGKYNKNEINNSLIQLHNTLLICIAYKLYQQWALYNKRSMKQNKNVAQSYIYNYIYIFETELCYKVMWPKIR